MRRVRRPVGILFGSVALGLLATLLPPASGAQTRLQVVATVAPIANLVRNIGGPRIDLVQIVPDGVDSHTFEPAPSDVRLIAQADLFILNGLNLEAPTRRLIDANRKPSAQILLLGDQTIARDQWVFDRGFPASRGNPNPHLWLNVAHARRYAELIRDKLVELDAPNAAYYQSNAEQFGVRLEQLDQAIFAATATVPEANRRLVTYHDSWPYFAQRYGWEVIAAIQPTDFAEPRARDIAAIVDQVRGARVPAVFGSEVFPSRVLEAIGRETGARYIDTLRDDALPGEPNAPEHSYVGMMLANVRIIVGALGGDPAALAGIDPSNIAR